MTSWWWRLFLVAILLSMIPAQVSGSDCIEALVRLSNVNSGKQNKTISLLRANEIDQRLISDLGTFAVANYFLEQVGITSLIDRLRIYNCFSQGQDSDSLCQRRSPCGTGKCVYEHGNYTCACSTGFTGPTCRHEVYECASQPCLNGGTCVDHINNFTCLCPEGLYGRVCESDHNECASGPCSHGDCVDIINGYECECHHGYAGRLCEGEINECLSSPCQHGTCRDHVGEYSCHCHRGYNGTNCEHDIDECASGPCQNKGTCQDHVNNYTCHCVVGYDGRQCENLWLTKEIFAKMEERWGTADDGLRRDIADLKASSKVWVSKETLTRMERQREVEEVKLRQEITKLKASRSTAYIRWGRYTCPATATLVYSGRAGGAHHQHKGGGVDTLCMPHAPIYGRHADFGWGGIIYTAVYQTQGRNAPFSSSLHGKIVPCALCLATSASVSKLIPARNVCPSGWRLEYHGYLQASNHDGQQRRTRYLCFDDQSVGYGNGGEAAQLFYRVAIQTGNGFPGSYRNARELTCAICSK